MMSEAAAFPSKFSAETMLTWFHSPVGRIRSPLSLYVCPVVLRMRALPDLVLDCRAALSGAGQWITAFSTAVIHQSARGSRMF